MPRLSDKARTIRETLLVCLNGIDGVHCIDIEGESPVRVRVTLATIERADFVQTIIKLKGYPVRICRVSPTVLVIEETHTSPSALTAMHPTLCQTFRSLAFRTFDQMGRALRVGHQPLEETFTDTNILELKDRHPQDIYCRTFTKPQEGINGADWEWWLTDAKRSAWLGLRVQAKVLHLESNTFAHLHYKSGKTKGYQASKLKRECATEGLIPLYCFYLHERPGATVRSTRCGSFAHAAEAYGCALAPLSHVEALRKRGEAIDFDSVIAGVLPWHCLVCCSGFGGLSLPDRAWSFLQSAMDIKAPRRRATANQSADIQRQTIGPRDRPPDYVHAIVEGSRDPDGIPKNIRGILVVRDLEG